MMMPSSPGEVSESDFDGGMGGSDEGDPLFEEAKALVSRPKSQCVDDSASLISWFQPGHSPHGRLGSSQVSSDQLKEPSLEKYCNNHKNREKGHMSHSLFFL